MKTRSLGAKTITTIIAGLVLAFILGVVFCAVFSTNYYRNVKQDSMVELNRELEDKNTGGSHERLSSFCEQNSISLLVSNPAGSIVFAYGNSSVLLQRLDDLTFFRGNMAGSYGRILKEGDNYTIQQVSDHSGKIIYIESWGFLSNGNAFIARSSFAGVQKEVSQTLKFFCIVCVVLLSLAGVGIYFFVKYYTEPIKKLLTYVQGLNEGDYQNKYEYKHFRQDEIGLLGATINQIGEKMEGVVSQLKTSNINLENELKAKTQLEEQRKKYMSDVSHELKTPIAVISGYAEGLREGITDSPEDRAYYCDVIIDEAEKMNLLVKKLSTLNQLEEGKSAVILERFDIVEVINGFLNTMSMIINDKQINVFFDNSYKEFVWSDEFLFEEVLVNYFNNALNHVDDNKIVRISVEKTDAGNIRVTVYNSGEQIPEEELNNLWGKFYKVDKARTREYGGSGLGLSIVKAIADSLNKECGVYNLDDGVAFYIDLESAAVQQDSHVTEPVADHVRLKLSDLPIWKATAGKIIREDRKPIIQFKIDTTKTLHKEKTPKEKTVKSKQIKEKPIKEKAVKEKPVKEKRTIKERIIRDKNKESKEISDNQEEKKEVEE